jgi:hypothetical protein
MRRDARRTDRRHQLHSRRNSPGSLCRLSRFGDARFTRNSLLRARVRHYLRSGPAARSGHEGELVKLLRTIRLDSSDIFVFETPAEPGEWAVSGAFAFARRDPATLQGKARTAFRAGFLGLNSLGRSTLAQIVEATGYDREAAVEMLARQLIDRFAAPDLATARTAAEDEVTFTASLCDHPPGVLIAVTRTVENGTIREAFRTLRPRAGADAHRAFEFFDVVGEDEPAEPVDLQNLRTGDHS